MLFRRRFLGYFRRSLQLYGTDVSTLYNMAVCHYRMRDREQALEEVGRALELQPTFEAARSLRIRLEAELARRAGGG